MTNCPAMPRASGSPVFTDASNFDDSKKGKKCAVGAIQKSSDSIKSLKLTGGDFNTMIPYSARGFQQHLEAIIKANPCKKPAGPLKKTIFNTKALVPVLQI